MTHTYTPRTIASMALLATVLPPAAAPAQAAVPAQSAAETPAPQPAVRLSIPHSYNPFHAYTPTAVPPANLANSNRLDTLVHNGVLELTLQDAIALALENNLDLAIARYNPAYQRGRQHARRQHRRGAEHARR